MKQIIFVLVAQSIAIASNLLDKSRFWNVDSLKKGSSCWCVIRAYDSTEAVYHIEVVCKGSKNPSWQIEKLAPHMAITPEALEKSVRKPKNKGDVYPEQYEEHKKKWDENKLNGIQPVVCKETIKECLPKTEK
jgi:hypothetical protein